MVKQYLIKLTVKYIEKIIYGFGFGLGMAMSWKIVNKPEKNISKQFSN